MHYHKLKACILDPTFAEYIMALQAAHAAAYFAGCLDVMHAAHAVACCDVQSNGLAGCLCALPTSFVLAGMGGEGEMRFVGAGEGGGGGGGAYSVGGGGRRGRTHKKMLHKHPMF